MSCSFLEKSTRQYIQSQQPPLSIEFGHDPTRVFPPSRSTHFGTSAPEDIQEAATKHPLDARILKDPIPTSGTAPSFAVEIEQIKPGRFDATTGI